MGNLLANEQVPQDMIDAFESVADMDLSSRLIHALSGGGDQGSELGELKSAGLIFCIDHSWPEVDLRVDWNESPIDALKEAWKVYKPQMNDYILRADSPNSAPSYGVPGNE